MKRKLMVLALIVLCLSIVAAGSAAYFTAEGTARNVITAGSVQVELIETSVSESGGAPVPFEDVTGVMPGAEISKIVQVKNTGSGAAYVRIAVDVRVTSESEEELDPMKVSMAINTADWTYSDGWFCYNRSLAAGETTEPLFESVVFANEMGNEYQNATATIDVSVQATQTANNGTSALTASGWPAA